jgi:hypothetical protein
MLNGERADEDLSRASAPGLFTDDAHRTINITRLSEPMSDLKLTRKHYHEV